MINKRISFVSLLLTMSLGSGRCEADTIVLDTQSTASTADTGALHVPMSITAATGDDLREQGITDAAGLAKFVPGFNFTQSAYGGPVYTLRGIGTYDEAIAISPAVGVYMDQIPLPFARMTEGVSLDLQRVEVLKGPQGTLFGETSTGGAVNYIPKRSFLTPMTTPGMHP